jgi:hypothetical protein
MRRRALLTAVGAGTIGALAGCTALEEQIKEMDAAGLSNCLDREVDGEYAAGRATDEGVSLGVRNEGGQDWTATVRIARDGESVVDETVTVEPSGFAVLSDGGITTTGDYEISVGVDGGGDAEGTWRVCRESFILVVLIEEEGSVRFRKPGRSYEEE